MALMEGSCRVRRARMEGGPTARVAREPGIPRRRAQRRVRRHDRDGQGYVFAPHVGAGRPIEPPPPPGDVIRRFARLGEPTWRGSRRRGPGRGRVRWPCGGMVAMARPG